MSNELKLEKVQDVLDIDQDKLKSTEAKAVIKRLKQLLKVDKAIDKEEQEEAGDLPYEAISIVGNMLVTVNFDLESKKGRVIKIEKDARDRRRATMATAIGMKLIDKMGNDQKLLENDAASVENGVLSEMVEQLRKKVSRR